MFCNANYPVTMVVNRVWVRVDLVHVRCISLWRVAFMLTYHCSLMLLYDELLWVMQISSCLKCRCTVRLQHNIRGIQSPSLISSVFQLFFWLWETVSRTLFLYDFQHEVGPISQCQISYNSKGQSTGVVTITFKNPGHAHKASVRFNGTSIDNGAKLMRLTLPTLDWLITNEVELVMDPSKKPLSRAW